MFINKIANNGINAVSQSIQKHGQEAIESASDAISSTKLSGLDALASYNLKSVINNKLIKFGNLEIEPIRSEKEFDVIMDSFKRTGSAEKKIFRNCFTTREDPSKYLQSLQGYLGENDISNYINQYMATGEIRSKMPVGIFSTGEILNLSQEDLHNYIRIMEYSLRKLDDTIPTYTGTVYRGGYFNKNGGQFFSSSKYPDAAVEYAASIGDGLLPLSVIKAKNGYDVEAINKNTRFASEKEVLLRPNSKYIDITDDIPRDELESYYAKIKKYIAKIIKENLGIEYPTKADEFIGSLRVYEQI